MTGAVQSLGGSGLTKLRRTKDPEFSPTLAVPELKRSSGGLAAYMGTIANLRYQAVGGLDRCDTLRFLACRKQPSDSTSSALKLLPERSSCKAGRKLYSDLVSF